MKKFLLGIIGMLMMFSLTACNSLTMEDNNSNKSQERDNMLIQGIYGNVDQIELSNPEQTENTKNLLVDIDSDGVNELLKLTYEYMENHLHVYTLNDEKPVELESEDYVAYITSVYVTDDGIYVAAADGDGLCYENASLLKLSILNKKVITKEILNVTCNQEAEEEKREKINNRLLAGEITEDEAFEESIAAHTLEYKVNGEKVSEEEFKNTIVALNKKQVSRKIAYLTNLFENLWNN